jgi:hypothetical protein
VRRLGMIAELVSLGSELVKVRSRAEMLGREEVGLDGWMIGHGITMRQTGRATLGLDGGSARSIPIRRIR